MTQILKFLFDRLVDPLGLPIESWKEYIILFAIGEVAYIIAFYGVRKMYVNHDISTSTGGSFFHWGIRAVVFFVVWVITYSLICLIKLIDTYYWWIVLGIGSLAIILAVIRICLNRFGVYSGRRNDTTR